MDEIGKHYLDKAVELVKEKKSFVIVLDNIDWTERVHDERKENQNKTVHAVASCLVFDRVSSSHLPDDIPQISNAEEKTKQAIPLTEEEIAETTRRYQTFVARILLEFFTFLKPFEKFTESHLKHKHSEETKEKSTVVNLPIIMKDEKKYSECVEIMDQLESWVEEIMKAAKADCELQEIAPVSISEQSHSLHTTPLLNLTVAENQQASTHEPSLLSCNQFHSSSHINLPHIPSLPNLPTSSELDLSVLPPLLTSISASSQLHYPSQTLPSSHLSTQSQPPSLASHPSTVTPQKDYDPTLGVQIPCFGDQLTRVRMAGAKTLRAGAHSAKDKFEHLHPFRIVHWHCKQSYLKVNITLATDHLSTILFP